MTVTAFDAHHPPKLDLVSDCVHCGFCLTTCPTYVLWGDEADSPRGRIDLMRQGIEGEPLSGSMVRHFDQCLGCMACVTACPSGVRYDKLIEDTRAQVERRHDRPLRQRFLRGAIFALFPYPRRLRPIRWVLMAYQMMGLKKLFGKRPMLGMTPAVMPAERLPRLMPAQGQKRATVGMLTGCVQSAFFPGVNAATARVLAAEGCDVVIPANQGCCGALSIHNGRRDEAQRFARDLIDAFDGAGVDFLVINAAGCGSSIKEYAELLAEDRAYADRAAALAAKTRDLTEILAELGPVAVRHELALSVAYHDACHLAHAQGVRAQPRALLAAIPNLRLCEIADAEICCGSAGIWNILHPQPARDLGDRKAASVAATGADLLVTANPGCLMQVAAALRRTGQAMPMAHTAQVLDASLRGVPASELIAAGRLFT